MVKSLVRPLGAAVATILAGGLLLGAAVAAAAAEDEVVGEVTATLDFSVAGAVHVNIYTRNLSGVAAYGWASVGDPDGVVHTWSTHFYEPGEEWTYETTLTGYTCSDLTAVWAAAYGDRNRGASPSEWTTGRVVYPDPRVTVIGCPTPSPTPSPTESVTPTPDPTITPTPTASPTATATPTGTPSATPRPTASSSPTPSTTTPPAAGSSGSPSPGALAVTGETAAGTIAVGIIGMVLLAVGALGVMRRRRIKE